MPCLNKINKAVCFKESALRSNQRFNSILRERNAVQSTPIRTQPVQQLVPMASCSQDIGNLSFGAGDIELAPIQQRQHLSQSESQILNESNDFVIKQEELDNTERLPQNSKY